MNRRSRPVGVLVLVVVASLWLGLGSASVALAVDYPSWEDVEAAKANEAATTREITKLESHINALEAESAESARTALELAEQYNVARNDLDAATTKVDVLDSQADAAAGVAEESSARAGQLIAQLARTSGGDITVGLLLSGSGSDDLLYRLGAMSKLSEQAADVYAGAVADRNAAASLGNAAQVARDARGALADTARTVLVDAESAAAVAAERVSAQERTASRLYEQLASLKGTTADIERGYAEGQIPTTPAPGIPPTTPPPMTTPPVTTPPVTTPPVVTPPVTTPVTPPVAPPVAPPDSGRIAGAIAFAKAQLGEAYRLGGAGPDAWDCSGLTRASYAAAGVNIGTHSASNQYSTMAARGRLVPRAQLVAGDLLFYSTGGNASLSKYHVTMYLGNGLMIEAPKPGVNVRIVGYRTADLVPYVGRPTG